MSLATMYAAKAGSPKTTLAAALAAADTSMTLTDASVLPAAPNLAVIGSDSDAEVVSYSAVTGNVVSGLVRGLGGTVASAWSAGEEVARNITSLDHDTFRANILDLDTRVPSSGDANRVLKKTASGNSWSPVDLATDVTGSLPNTSVSGLGSMATVNSPVPIANGGTGATTNTAALTALGAMAARPAVIELTPSSSATNGGVIDFHYAGSASDYTTRIIERPQNTLAIVASAGMTLNGTPVLTGSYTTGTPSASSYITSNNTTYYRIGNVVIVSFSIQVTGLTSTSGNIDSNLLLLSGLPNAKDVITGLAFENNNASYYRLRVKVTTSGTLVTMGNQKTATYLSGAMYSGQLIYFCED